MNLDNEYEWFGISEDNDSSAQNRLNEFLNIGNEKIEGSSREINPQGVFSGKLKDNIEPEISREDLNQSNKANQSIQSGQKPDAPKGGSSTFLNSLNLSTISSREIIVSAVEVITIPEKTPHLILMILNHEALSADCPLDYVEDGKAMKFFDPDKKEGRFSILRDSEMLLIFLSTLWEKELDYKSESGWYEVYSGTWNAIDHRYGYYVKWLIKNNLLECDNSWSDGKLNDDRFCKSYRWNPEVKDVEQYRLQDKFALRKYLKPATKGQTTPKYYQESVNSLKSKIDSLEINISAASNSIIEDFKLWNEKNPEDRMKIKDLMVSLVQIKRLSDIEAIRNSYIRAKKTTRVYSRLTSIPRCVKGKGICEIIRLNGEATMELDIRCSQPSILWNLFNTWKPLESDLNHFQGNDLESLKSERIAELNKMYDWLTSTKKMNYKVDGIQVSEDADFYNRMRAAHIKINSSWSKEKKESFGRDEMKTMIYNFMFSEMYYDMGEDIRVLVKKEFPILFDYVFSKLRSEGKPLWRELSKIESEMVIDTVCPEVAKLGFDFFSCHDSIRFPASKYDQVYPIWKKVLNDFGIPNNLS